MLKLSNSILKGSACPFRLLARNATGPALRRCIKKEVAASAERYIWTSERLTTH